MKPVKYHGAATIYAPVVGWFNRLVPYKRRTYVPFKGWEWKILSYGEDAGRYGVTSTNTIDWR